MGRKCKRRKKLGNENILFFISNGPWLLLAWSKSFFLQGNDMGRKRQLFFKLLLKLS
jgi:hypothetical protein